MAPAPPAAAVPSPRREEFLHYELIKRLPAGGMADVYQAKDLQADEIVCLKRVRANSVDADALNREVQIYSKIHDVECPNLLRVRDFFRTDEYLTLVMDFAAGGDLAAFVRQETNQRLTAPVARGIAIQIARGLEALHKRNIVHRDLKPENVLLNGDNWQIADYGIAKNLTRLMTVKTFQAAGTLGYMAPEQMDGTEAKLSADIYSFGKIMVFMLTGTTDKDYVIFPWWRTLLLDCLSGEPERRPTITQVLAALERPLG
jgi:serine/threonine-protein kinase